jgi:hypothetical protein
MPFHLAKLMSARIVHHQVQVQIVLPGAATGDLDGPPVAEYPAGK